MQVTLELEEDLTARSPAFNRVLRNLPAQWIREGADIYESQMQIEVPISSGRLQSSIRSVVNDKEAVISTNTGYGKAVDEGRRGFFVQARRARVLRFFIGAKLIFSKYANVGPGRANRFIKRTLINARPRILSMIERVFEEKISEV